MPSNDYILQSYVNVCNHALRLNAERFPFKQILGAAQKSEQNRKVEVIIQSGEKPDNYVFSMEGAQIIMMNHGDCSSCDCVRQWFVSREYLVDVAQNAKKYIQNPAKINWEWLYDVPISN